MQLFRYVQKYLILNQNLFNLMFLHLIVTFVLQVKEYFFFLFFYSYLDYHPLLSKAFEFGHKTRASMFYLRLWCEGVGGNFGSCCVLGSTKDNGELFVNECTRKILTATHLYDDISDILECTVRADGNA